VLQAKLALAPDHEEPGTGDNGRAHINQLFRQFAEQPVA
jgi:hypothetical protein